SYMALPFKFLGYVAYHVIYRPLNAFVITPLKNVYNYFFNPEKYYAQSTGKTLSEVASAVGPDRQSSAEKDRANEQAYAKWARAAAKNDEHKAEMEKRKPKAAVLNEFTKKIAEGSLNLEDTKGRTKAVREATGQVLHTDTAEYARKGNVSADAEFKKEQEAYNKTVEAHTKAMEEYQTLAAEAQKNGKPLPEQPVLTVKPPVKAPTAKCTDDYVKNAFLMSKAAEKEATFTAQIAQMRAELKKAYPDLYDHNFVVHDEVEKISLEQHMEDHEQTAHYQQMCLGQIKLEGNSKPEATWLQGQIAHHIQNADVIRRNLEIYSKECELKLAQEYKAGQIPDILEWRQGRDRLKLDIRAKQTVEKDKDDKIIDARYEFNKEEMIKNRPLPITRYDKQQGLTWSKVSFEKRPYAGYEAVRDDKHEVTGSNAVADKRNHWVVNHDPVNGHDNFGPVIKASTPHDKSAEEDKTAIGYLQNWVNLPDQEDVVDVDRTISALHKEIRKGENADDFSELDEDEGSITKNAFSDLPGSKWGDSDFPVLDDDEGSISDSYDLEEAAWNLDREEFQVTIDALKKTNQEQCDRVRELVNANEFILAAEAGKSGQKDHPYKPSKISI
ncbi:hypothetical protein, partial [Endozoicomonas sp.]|uniref:hypothetical protein n=1 Tax=Endozoicomonas sp. TaxID=1892382 RepID=UPI00383B3F75